MPDLYMSWKIVENHGNIPEVFRKGKKIMACNDVCQSTNILLKRMYQHFICF